MHLSQQERGKRFAGLAVKIVTCRIISGSLLTVESELATLIAGRPSREWELMPAILKADFDGVLSLDPGQVVGKLPAIVGQESEVSPAILSEGVVGYGALEIESMAVPPCHRAVRHPPAI